MGNSPSTFHLASSTGAIFDSRHLPPHFHLCHTSFPSAPLSPSTLQNLSSLSMEISRKALLSHTLNLATVEDKLGMADTEEQLRHIKAENAELKKSLRRVYTLLSSTITKVRNGNTLMSGRIGTISETLDYAVLSISNIDSKTDDNNRNIIDVEGKIDKLSDEVSRCLPSIQDNAELEFGKQHDPSVESVPGPPAQHYRCR